MPRRTKLKKDDSPKARKRKVNRIIDLQHQKLGTVIEEHPETNRRTKREARLVTGFRYDKSRLTRPSYAKLKSIRRRRGAVAKQARKRNRV